MEVQWFNPDTEQLEPCAATEVACANEQCTQFEAVVIVPTRGGVICGACGEWIIPPAPPEEPVEEPVAPEEPATPEEAATPEEPEEEP